MPQQSNPYRALARITSILLELDIPYQLAGGLAARSYGATRPLHDIDFYVPGKAMPVLEEHLKEYIDFGPDHYIDDQWDLIFMRINFEGQQIEFGDADRTHYFDTATQKWIKEKIDFSSSIIKSIGDIEVPVMPKHQLIEYKKRLNRKVDQLDIKEIQG